MIDVEQAIRISKKFGVYRPLSALVRWARKMEVRLSALFFRNGNLLKYNFDSVRYLAEIKRRMKTARNLPPKPSPVPGPFDIPALAEQMRRDHVIHVRDFHSPERIGRIYKHFLELLNDDRVSHSYMVDDLGRPIQRTIYDVPANFPEVAELIDERVSQILYGYYGTWFKLIGAGATRNFCMDPAANSKEGYSNFWHFDQHISCYVKYFIWLNDVDDKTGPLFAMPNGNALKMIRSGYFKREEWKSMERLLEDPQYRITATGRAGSISLCNTTYALHRASSPEGDNYRDCLQLFLLPCEYPSDLAFGGPGTLQPEEQKWMERIHGLQKDWHELEFPLSRYCAGEIRSARKGCGLIKAFREGIIAAGTNWEEKIPYAEMSSLRVTEALGRTPEQDAKTLQAVSDMSLFHYIAPPWLYLQMNGELWHFILDYGRSLRAADNKLFLATMAKLYLRHHEPRAVSDT